MALSHRSLLVAPEVHITDPPWGAWPRPGLDLPDLGCPFAPQPSVYELVRAPGFAHLPLIVEDFVKDAGASFSGELGRCLQVAGGDGAGQASRLEPSPADLGGRWL